MKAVCVENVVRNLPISQRIFGESLETQHPLTVGKNYDIYAMILLENRLRYLVVNDWDYPRFHPAAFFGAFEATLPQWWCYGLGEGIHEEWPAAQLNLQSIWGYPEMVHDSQHREKLILGDPEAQKIFDKYAGMSDGV